MCVRNYESACCGPQQKYLSEYFGLWMGVDDIGQERSTFERLSTRFTWIGDSLYYNYQEDILPKFCDLKKKKYAISIPDMIFYF